MEEGDTDRNLLETEQVMAVLCQLQVSELNAVERPCAGRGFVAQVSNPVSAAPPVEGDPTWRKAAHPRGRVRVRITGAVQGVGFRPFVYRLAGELGLTGWVLNDGQGVLLEGEGPTRVLETFLAGLTEQGPPGGRVESCEAVWLEATGAQEFVIRESEVSLERRAWIRPDSATCEACLRELWDPADRRYRYPFTNCTHCGPRYTIIERLPYDRPHTSMRRFKMCSACEAEYRDPANRRFHAQPNACPDCGPRLALWDAAGLPMAEGDTALIQAAAAVRAGSILALKGLGGFHLVVRAGDAEAVRRLRARKHREQKPFALMFPSLAHVRQVCHCSAIEARSLGSPEAPIVLLSQRTDAGVAKAVPVAGNVAPGQVTLGVMLPYTPLHHLLMRELGWPVVATSGNLSDEPICIDEQEALQRLSGIADLFLVHDRPIVRQVDDSIVRVMAGRELVLRRARGFAPLPVPMELPETAEVVLGVGAHFKNSVALGLGPNVFLSQHLGDLETVEAYDAFRRVVADLELLYEARPAVIAADLHPDYLSSQYARASGTPVITVQHHLAHIAAVLAENDVTGPALGVSWDGTGLGEDGTIWGGEFLRVDGATWERVARLRPFPLPGGDLAAREPRRSALGLLMAWSGGSDLSDRCAGLPTLEAFTSQQLDLVIRIIRSRINTPLTSSMGRLFDAVASLLGICHQSQFEGQAAMGLETAAAGMDAVVAPYPLPLRSGGSPAAPPQLDWAPLLEELTADLRAGTSRNLIARRFHEGLVGAMVEVARWAGIDTVALGGGCFQNRWLLEGAVDRLRAEGFRVVWPQRVPPNDGGLALGQVAWARRRRVSGW